MSDIEDALYPKEFSEADIYLLIGYLSVEWEAADKLTGPELIEVAKKAIDVIRDKSAWAVPAS